MAKTERMVTRTITNNKLDVKVYDFENDEIKNIVLEITGNYDVIEMDKACEKRLSGSTYKFLKVKSCDGMEKLYAMPETTFLLYAKEVEPRKSKEG